MIGNIKGTMLNTNLERNGVDLSFDNDLMILDVTNRRIGINTNPQKTFDVNGDISATSYFSGATEYTADTLTTSAYTIDVNDLTIAAVNQFTVTGTNGIAIPGGTTIQRPLSPAPYTTRFNTNYNYIEIYDGVQWSIVGPAAFAGMTSQVLTGDNTTTDFALSRSTSSQGIIVHINGTVQIPEDSYSVTGTTLSFVEAPTSADTIEVRYITETISLDDLSNTSGQTGITVATTIDFRVNGNNSLQITDTNSVNASNNRSIQLPEYTQSQLSSITNPQTREMVYVTDGDVGNPCLAIYDGSNWRAIVFGNIL